MNTNISHRTQHTSTDSPVKFSIITKKQLKDSFVPKIGMHDNLKAVINYHNLMLIP